MVGESVSKMRLPGEGLPTRAEGQIQKPVFQSWKQEMELPEENLWRKKTRIG